MQKANPSSEAFSRNGVSQAVQRAGTGKPGRSGVGSREGSSVVERRSIWCGLDQDRWSGTRWAQVNSKGGLWQR